MYSYENYDKVKNEIEKRRKEAIAEADRRSAALGQISEEIRAIDTELSGTGLLLFKTACKVVYNTHNHLCNSGCR